MGAVDRGLNIQSDRSTDSKSEWSSGINQAFNPKKKSKKNNKKKTAKDQRRKQYNSKQRQSETSDATSSTAHSAEEAARQGGVETANGEQRNMDGLAIKMCKLTTKDKAKAGPGKRRGNVQSPLQITTGR
jgi:hypothetical protein